MNKLLSILYSILPVIIFQSCQNCKSVQSDYPVDPVLKSFFSNKGSYLVYKDSTDQINDSQYVCYYNYSAGAVYVSSLDGCESFSDQINMTQISYRNGLIYDTISSGNQGVATYLYINEPFEYFYDEGPTLGLYNGPVLSNFYVGGNIYHTVYKDTSAFGLIENSDTVPVDLYFAPNYGIVKRVEHRPTGDVSWDLIRYHIVH